MAAYSYCMLWLMKKKDDMNQQLWWSRQCKERGASIYFSKGLSAVHLKISFKHTSTREMLELVRLKTCNYNYFIAQSDLHFGELIISIIVSSKIDENCCKQTLARHLDFGRAGSLYFTVILNLPQLTAYAPSSE